MKRSDVITCGQHVMTSRQQRQERTCCGCPCASSSSQYHEWEKCIFCNQNLYRVDAPDESATMAILSLVAPAVLIALAFLVFGLVGFRPTTNFYAQLLQSAPDLMDIAYSPLAGQLCPFSGSFWVSLSASRTCRQGMDPTQASNTGTGG
jgi:hypothetical protein